MALNQEFLAGLQNGMDHDSLLDMVHRYQRRGMSPREAYDTLQQIWLDFGFDKIEEGSGLQDNLEYVMEKTWYECPAVDG
jgi:hypothetical protein